MKHSSALKSDDEIDLQELFISLWVYKPVIVFFCLLGIILGGYSINSSKKIFSSNAIFMIKSDSNGLNMPDLALLPNYIKGEKNNISNDKFFGRIFVEKMDNILDFRSDPFYNYYDPNYTDPLWKALIKKLIGWNKSNNIEEVILQNIKNSYAKYVKIKETKDVIKITAQHPDAERAANIANALMKQLISDYYEAESDRRNRKLEQLSDTLAKALNDLELSQLNVKTFKLENSALPIESFSAVSLKLDSLRDQLNRTVNLHSAMTELKLLLKNKTTSNEDYLLLKNKFPIVDQVEFRRVLGQNEISNSWGWPKESSVVAVLDTLSERINRLSSQIDSSQINAKRSSKALETYAKLERELKVSEAVYSVLIQQVNSESLLSEIASEEVEIYEYASPSIRPSSPNHVVMLIIGALIGSFFGMALSLIYANSRKVYFSKRIMFDDTRAKIILKAQILRRFRQKPLSEIKLLLMQESLPEIRNLILEINKFKSKYVIINSLDTELLSNDVALVVASYMQSSFNKVAVLNFSGSVLKSTDNKGNTIIQSFICSKKVDHVSILHTNDDIPILDKLKDSNFTEILKSLDSCFDMIVMCADNDDTKSLLHFFEGQDVFHILAVKMKNTKSQDLKNLVSLLPVQGLIYE
jgi:uncharacterized protein involved in exopolysaccharide biosynthesis